MKHKFAGWHVVVGLAAILALGVLAEGAAAEKKIQFSLGWLPTGMHVGYFSALEKGYFRQEEFDVSIVRGFGAGETVKTLAAGGYDMALVGTGALIQGRAQGVAVKAVGMFLDKSLDALFVLKGTGITKPADMKGRSIGASKFSAPMILFPAVAAINGVDMKDVKWEQFSPGSEIANLMAGRVDAIAMWTVSFPQAEHAARKAGKEVVAIPYRDWGLDVYTNTVCLRDETIQKDPARIRGLLKASMEGTAWAIDNPEAGIELYLKHNRDQTREIVQEVWTIAADAMDTPAARSKGLGWMTAEKWKVSRDVLTKTSDLKRDVPIEGLYTNEFLPGIFPAKWNK
jgi:NitT/TauT family transport system substrate-binding protein